MPLLERPEEGRYISNTRHKGVAFVVSYNQVLNHYWDPDLDEEHEVMVPDGQVIAIMVGDDRRHTLDLDDCDLLPEEDFCGGCGQIGCGHG